MQSNSGLSNIHAEYFETWGEALYQAGYSARNPRQRVSTEALMNDLVEVIKKTEDGRKKNSECIDISGEDIKKFCRFHPETYRCRFGSIKCAVEKAHRMI
jgi:hypothetical protein